MGSWKMSLSFTKLILTQLLHNQATVIFQLYVLFE